MSFQQSSAPDGAGQARGNLRGKRHRQQSILCASFLPFTHSTKKTPVNRHSALDAESSVFKHRNVWELKPLDPASERGVMRWLFLE